MIGLEELGRQVERAHLLLDACFLICATKKELRASYSEIIKFFEAYHCVRITSDASHLEYIRFAGDCKEREKLAALLREDLGVSFSFPINQKEFAYAEKLALLYSFRNRRFAGKINPMDCLNAAITVNKRDLILVTEDIEDYPTTIFDCLYLWPVAMPTDRSLSAVGFFRLNPDKLAAEIEEYNAGCPV